MTITSKAAEMMQGFKESERLPVPPVPTDLQIGLDEARAAHKQAVADHAKLITEQDTLPLLIGKAADAGNTVLTRQLKARQADVAFDIMQSEVDALTAELDVVKLKHKIAGAQGKIAKKRLDDAVAAQEEAAKAVRITQAGYARFFAETSGSDQLKLESKLRALKARYAHILSGSDKPRTSDGYDY